MFPALFSVLKVKAFSVPIAIGKREIGSVLHSRFLKPAEQIF